MNYFKEWSTKMHAYSTQHPGVVGFMPFLGYKICEFIDQVLKSEKVESAQNKVSKFVSSASDYASNLAEGYFYSPKPIAKNVLEIKFKVKGIEVKIDDPDLITEIYKKYEKQFCEQLAKKADEIQNQQDMMKSVKSIVIELMDAPGEKEKEPLRIANAEEVIEEKAEVVSGDNLNVITEDLMQDVVGYDYCNPISMSIVGNDHAKTIDKFINISIDV